MNAPIRAASAPRPGSHLKTDLQAFEPFGTVLMPDAAPEPILPPDTREAVHQWLKELGSANLLAEVGVEPRQRIMLSGPPGTGKTSLTHHVAGRLGMPLVVVESAALIKGVLGGTGQQLTALFRLARQHQDTVAVFFDEIDALAPNRDNATTDERANIVNALIQLLDGYGDRGILVAATNRPDALDKAIWDRFQMQIEVGMPGEDERFAIVRCYLAPLHLPDDAIWLLADVLAKASPRELRSIIHTIKRDLVMARVSKLDTSVAAVLSRVSVAMKPTGADRPMLWADPKGALDHVKSIAWPPTKAV